MSKQDIKQINAIAQELGMSQEERREFGKFIEFEKANGYGGSKNQRGDFTYQELKAKAREFLGGD